MLFVEPDTATLAVVESADGSITDVYKELIDAESYDEATAQLAGMVCRARGAGIGPAERVFASAPAWTSPRSSRAGDGDVASGERGRRAGDRAGRGARAGVGERAAVRLVDRGAGLRARPRHRRGRPLRRCPGYLAAPTFRSVTESVKTSSPTALVAGRGRRRAAPSSSTRDSDEHRVAGRSCCSVAGWRWSPSARWWRWRSRWRSASARRSRCSPARTKTSSSQRSGPRASAGRGVGPEAEDQPAGADGGAPAVQPASRRGAARAPLPAPAPAGCRCRLWRLRSCLSQCPPVHLPAPVPGPPCSRPRRSCRCRNAC